MRTLLILMFVLVSINVATAQDVDECAALNFAMSMYLNHEVITDVPNPKTSKTYIIDDKMWKRIDTNEKKRFVYLIANYHSCVSGKRDKAQFSNVDIVGRDSGKKLGKYGMFGVKVH